MKLRDCPFCGSNAVLMRDALWHGSHGYHGCYEVYVQCTNKKCRVTLPYGNYNTIYLTLEEAEQRATDKWNNAEKEETI